jgi:hypothetical protein
VNSDTRITHHGHQRRHHQQHHCGDAAPPGAPAPAQSAPEVPADGTGPARGEASAAALPSALPPPPGGHAPLEGFDHGKLANLNHKTPKYLFARVAQQFGLESVKDKAAGEALLQKMVPYMKAAGLEIAGVKGDKINVRTDIGWEWVDVIRGAGSGDPGWWWGSEGKGSRNPGPHGPGNEPTGENKGGAGTPAGPVPPGGPAAPGGELTTVPPNPAWRNIRIGGKSPMEAVLAAARWVRENRPEYFDKGEDRPTAYKMMTDMIGILRANGYDAHRVVNHPSRPVGDPGRYGKDALVLDGVIFDAFQAWGDPGGGTPQALDVGRYGDRPRE